ncbi:DEAD/DEAH box helicase [Dasania sp. GY-MA-18]|uniref:ATP-dependent RNA helicase DeaD n=1 Tax=Dasania phycosphaerae TaxID=2950436 RepID=A0A9J6RHZ5_9GAMM|nr:MULTISPECIES: DEAD/DEAH box helicase [Dasania]MCR8921460.1 DEAD/DEAH box helicase [Dasania sp. GY-MA-18]MCZ0863888.1 DEAD/DEAH box helicase [Dasania phycosphaerae]MCZ0867616.1 DEAD/DEAH box helicase [Dasania phycosphaerae]
MSSPETTSFSDLALSAPVLKAIQSVGYEQPSPIQAASIPHLLNGEDLLGVAQTGTGKTAAFALPLLSNIDVKTKAPQVLVLAPTRELAIQVAEAFKSYASQMKGFQVLPIYGGQDMRGQLKQLERGPQVVVGTPGRVMDHLRRGSLKLDALKCVVLDEADEMLRMGFIDDVEWILEHTPEQRQVALFSATMPGPIKKVADTYLRNPKEVRIASATQTGSHIKQSYLIVNGFERKLDAITRILEAQDFDAMIIFVRTKTATAELAEKLEARGYSASALNGDMNQQLRERTINRLKNKQLDIVVATDVAARGIDVERVSHVLNFDIPYDSEAYVHRIGRTGRAGRDGSAILFVAPREKRLLFSIEKNTRQKIEPMELPSGKEVSSRRVEQFKQLLTDTLESQPNLDYFFEILSEYSAEHDRSAEDIACALAYLHQLERPLEVKDSPKGRKEKGFTVVEENRQSRSGDSDQMMRYRIELGRDQQVGPGDIVGAIMNETDLHKNDIGHIKLHGDHSTVDLPLNLPKELISKLKTLTVRNLPINISEVGPAKREQRQPGKRKSAPGAHNKAPRKKPRKAKKD